MRLTGKEPWFVASQQGAVIWCRQWGDSNKWWWPMVFLDLDTGLCKIDVLGKTENKHLDDFAQIRVDQEEPIEWQDFCEPKDSKPASE
jgi:hypothetical protein